MDAEERVGDMMLLTVICITCHLVTGFFL